MRGATLWMTAVLVVSATGAIVGCNVAGAQQKPAGQKPAPAQPAAGQPRPGAAQAGKPGQPARPKPAAGVPIQVVADPKATLKLMPTKTYVPRTDPFSLMQVEREYEQKMLAQNLSARYGSFPLMYTEPPERVERPVMEPQPYRRLAAVLVGESVTALIDMGDFVGGMLKYLRDHKVPRLTIAGGVAKMTKLAQGLLDLHSARGSVDLEALAEMARASGGSEELAARIVAANTTAEAFSLAAAEGIKLGDTVAERAWETAVAVLAGTGTALDTVIFDRDGQLVGRSEVKPSPVRPGHAAPPKR